MILRCFKECNTIKKIKNNQCAVGDVMHTFTCVLYDRPIIPRCCHLKNKIKIISNITQQKAILGLPIKYLHVNHFLVITVTGLLTFMSTQW